MSKTIYESETEVAIWFESQTEAQNAGINCADGWEEADIYHDGGGWVLILRKL